MEQGHSKRNIRLFLIIILLIIAAFAGGIWFYQQMLSKKAQSELDELAELVNASAETDSPESAREEAKEPENEPEEDGEEPESVRLWADLTIEEKYQSYAELYGIDVPHKELDFEDLQSEVNADIYAWITVSGTKVDYPVVQHPTDDTYYLDYNLDGSKGYPGGIYTESCNAKDFSDRMTVIYGHNMKNDTAFGSLHDFEKQDFFDQNRYIFIYLPDDILVYEIFAVYEGSNTHILWGHEWDDETWVQYLDETLQCEKAGDHALESHEFRATDKVVTLSTCIWNAPASRYLVQGVLLDKGRNVQDADSD